MTSNNLKIPKLELPCKITLTSDEYHASSAVGSSSLKNILRSPAHYLYELNNKSEPTPAQELGTAIHEALLEPNLFEANSIVMPKFEGTGSVAKRENWKLENHGKRILKSEDFERIQGILSAVKANKTASKLLTAGAAEESYFTTCPDTRIVIKARPDYLREGHIIVDVKSTVDASPEAFARQIAKYHYDLSAAHYLNVVSSVLGQTYDTFIIVAVEKEPPYAIGVYLLDAGTIDAGKFKCQRALRALKQCRDTGAYPAYPDAIQTIGLPHWAFPSEDE